MRLLLVLTLGLSLIASCPPPGDSTPTPSPLAEAVRRLEAAQSYRFEVRSSHRWSFEGGEEDWGFSGGGRAKKGSLFSSVVSGTADVYLKVTIRKGKVSCEDTRGPVAPPQCNTTFGGPRPGAAPYTIIAYLRHSNQIGQAEAVYLEDREALYMTFEPKMEAVAALDEAHAQALKQVTFRRGEVWVDMERIVPLRERVVIEYHPEAANAEAITTTIDFTDYVETEQ